MKEHNEKIKCRKYDIRNDKLCQYCGYNSNISNVFFRGVREMRIHKKEMHPDEPDMECDTCGKKYPHRYYLRHHLRTHLDELKKHQCKFCAKKFLSFENLVKHHRVHTGERPYICEICARTFTQESSLQSHLKAHVRLGNNLLPKKNEVFNYKGNSDEVPVVHPCTLCNYGNEKIDTLFAHLRTKHGRTGTSIISGLKGLYCRLCNIIFSTHEKRTEHSIEHLPYECEHCNKRFTNPDTLKGHTKMHAAGNRPYKCNVSTNKIYNYNAYTVPKILIFFFF